MNAADAFRRFVDRLTLAGAGIVQHVLPAPTQDVRAQFGAPEGVKLPDDLLAFWRVYDGCAAGDRVLEQEWMDGVFMYFSATDARADYDICLPLWADDPDFLAYWPPRFVPVATPGDGSRLLVNCDAASPTYGAVYDLFHGVGVSKCAASLAQHFGTRNALFDAGIISVTPEGLVSFDFEADTSLAQKMNPGCNHWDTSLPSCFEAPDWRPLGI